jgi:Glycosyltransferases involved in cell wall biogenesis
MALRLSIIIPFYNVERFIADCLDSVFNQDIPLSDYEVICVNDGSPDHSRDIVLQYMERFPNLRLIEHEKNKKLGAARNTGRTIARGRYIWNVDSDDKIVPNCLSEMLGICEENDLDVLEFRPVSFSEEGEKELPSVPPTQYPLTGLDYMEHLDAYTLSQMSSVWRKMIRRSFLDDNGIFSPEINYGEDVPYSFKVLISARRLMCVSKICYKYRSNPDALTGKNWSPNARSLYEKCFHNAQLIHDVSSSVPKKYVNVTHSFNEAAAYTLKRYTLFFGQMGLSEQKEFRRICRGAFFKNSFVFHLLSRKQQVCYLLWLIGIRQQPN